MSTDVHSQNEGSPRKPPAENPEANENVASRAQSRVKFQLPESPGVRPQNGSRQMANVYHAVAGRVNKNGFRSSTPYASRHHDTASSGARDLRPEEILYRSKPKLLKKILEDDSYFAHEKLPPDQPLPNSSILEALHAYSADFYESQARKQSKHDHHTMDESALLAMGILVEELAKEEMGETGDLVLVEGQYSDDEEGEGWATDESTASGASRKRKRRSRPTTEGPANNSLHMRTKYKRRRHKRIETDTD